MYDPATLDAIRFFLFGIGGGLLILGLLMLDKWGLLPRPPFLPNNFWIGGVLILGAYVLTFLLRREPLRIHLQAFVVFVVPLLLIFTLPVWRAVKAYFKEFRLYQRAVVEGEGRETRQWGSIKTYIERDVTAWFRASKNRIIRTVESPLYLGRTLFEYDFRIGRRDIGLVSEQHMLTIAATSSGSRDAISNNLLSYTGGIVAFDMKAEHTRLCHERRSAYAPFHVIDPWNLNGCGLTGAIWNPLDEIDPNDPTTRSRLQRLSKALLVSHGNTNRDTEDRSHASQVIIRGYMAHVLTAFPLEQRNLGTVYDLLILGDSSNKAFDPKILANVIKEMAENTACGGAPAEAAAMLSKNQGTELSRLQASLAKALDWINDTKVRTVITGRSSFSFRDCKTKNASVFLIIPQIHLTDQIRFARAFYQAAFDLLKEHETPQPEASRRRVLFLFDEFHALGNFPPAREAVLRDDSSFLKCWFIVQTLGQIKEHYPNPADFLTTCDKQFFGIDGSDRDVAGLISNALGKYTVMSRDTQGNERPESRELFPEKEIAKTLNADTEVQVVIPVKGLPMKLKRVPVPHNFGRNFHTVQQAKQFSEAPTLKTANLDEARRTTPAPSS